MANETEKKVEINQETAPKQDPALKAEGAQDKPKKKKLITVVRPQNSKGFVKAGQRPGTGQTRRAGAGAESGGAQRRAGANPAGKKGIAARTPEAARAAAYAKAKAEENARAEAAARAQAEAKAAEEAVLAAQEAARKAEEARKAEAAARAAALAKKEAEDAKMAEEAARVEANRLAQAEAKAAKAAKAAQEQRAAAGASSAPAKSADEQAGAAKTNAGRTNGGANAQGTGASGASGNAGRNKNGAKGSRDGAARDGARSQGSGNNRDASRGDGKGGRFGQGKGDNQRGENKGDSRRASFGNKDRSGGSAKNAPVDSGKSFDKDSRKGGRKNNNKSDHGDKFDRKERSQNQAKGGGKPKNGAKTVKPVTKPAPKAEEKIRSITIPETLTIKDLADALKIAPAAIVKKLFLQGKMVTVNEEIDFDTAEEIAMEYDVLCEKEEKVDVIAELLKDEEDPDDTLVERPPVVCVMGHVDHGKTSLLDAIRNTHVIDREAGGITQHIGASVVTCNGKKITFLDTPGHEAFTSMRMRGANSTDIAILVVAADDGVMPQTVEAINHAKAAGIEIIVAINKIDKPGANVDKVKQELTEYELIPEDWGGSTVFAEVSAKTHEGIDNLLEMILLTAEVLELKANPNRRARGLVIEAQLDRGRGPLATVLIQKGTLHVSDPICAGDCYGKVRAMYDSKGRSVKEAGPSTPVSVIGFSNVPGAGEIMVSPETEKEARAFSETFINEGKERLIEDSKKKMSLDDLFSQIQAGNLKELNLIVKADVQGSVEAVKQSLLKLSNEEIVVKVIHSGAGNINESDVILASASNAIIIGFNVKPDPQAKATAEQEGVDIRLYSVIYDAIADVENAMKGMLDPIYEEKVLGHAQVRQTFRASGVGTIAGSYVLDGVFQRGCSARLTRNDKVIFEGPIASLKRFKDDVKEVKAGYECGIVFEKFNDVNVDDMIEAFTMVEVPR